jgi:hypothetical protein
MKKIMLVAFSFWIHGHLCSQVIGKQPDLSHEIVIELTEPLNTSHQYMSLSLDLVEKGSYFFKKAETLFIPPNYTAVLEDRLTGNIFDLLSDERHSFSVSRPTSREFILRIIEKKNDGNEVTTLAK